MLDHIGIAVGDYARSRDFYEKALEPLGIELLMTVEDWAGFGRAGTKPEDRQRTPSFWIHSSTEPLSPVHVAFTAVDRAQVRAFHQAALAAGGRDNGGPGLRQEYHPAYYGAFVLDPDGHNIEAVCHAAA